MTDVVVVGSYVQDLTFYTQVFPAPGETRIGTFITGPGGKGSNQAVACNRQRVSTMFIGAVGDDVFGQCIRDFAAAEGIRAELQVCSDHPTGAAGIVVNAQAENLIVVSLGACDHLAVDHVASFASEISQAKCLVCQVENYLPATMAALQIAREHGVTTVLNPAPINQGLTLDLVRLADILVPNETEFAFLMEHLFNKKLPTDYWTEDDESIHAHCCEAGIATVVLTLGEKGCFVSHNPHLDRPNPRMKNAEAYYRVPAIQIDAQDTTGAGDAFNGGLAAGMVRFHDDFEHAIRYANTVAGLSTTKPGTAPSMPTRAEVDAFL